MAGQVSRSLARAYRDTRFVVGRPGRDIVLRAGSLNTRLKSLLESHGVETWAFITAWNPRSRQLSTRQNTGRNARLRADIVRAGYGFLTGHGEGQDTNWPAEESFLILGIPQSQARRLGRRYGQHAIVCGHIGSRARLLWCL